MTARLVVYGVWLGWPALLLPLIFWADSIPVVVSRSLLLTAMIYPLPAMLVTVRQIRPAERPTAATPGPTSEQQ